MSKGKSDKRMAGEKVTAHGVQFPGSDLETPPAASPAAHDVQLVCPVVACQLPATAEDCEFAILDELTCLSTSETKLAILVATWKQLAGVRTKDLIAMAQERLHLAERTTYGYLAAGEFLTSADLLELPGEARQRMVCGVRKTEQLARLWNAKGMGAVAMFLDRHDPREMTYDEVETLVTKCMPPLKLENARARKEGIEAKAAESAVRPVLRIGIMPPERVVTAVRRIGAPVCFEAGLQLLGAAIDCNEDDPTRLTPAIWQDWISKLNDGLAATKKMAAAAGLEV